MHRSLDYRDLRPFCYHAQCKF